MQDFQVEGAAKCLESVFLGSGQNLTTGKALKLWGIFQKFALKLFKIWKPAEKISEKFKDFKKIIFFARGVGKNKKFYT